MIGWLQGQLSDPWQQAHRCGLLVVCHGVGYEVQVSPRCWRELPPPGSDLTLHIHQSIRDDASVLYGFAARLERDLFRELVAVSGVGPQMALGLLGTLSAEELIHATVHGDLRTLARAPGVGKRTAERLSVELRSKLQDRFLGLIDGLDPADEREIEGTLPPLTAASRDELQITLGALGYEPLEIHRAMRGVASQDLAADAGPEEWIRECLRWLSGRAA